MAMRRFFFALMILTMTTRPAAADLVLHAAGSLKDALGEVAGAFARAHGGAVKTEFGPSGLLRQRIETGATVDVFASANMGHPAALMKAGKGGPVVLFARNRLCAIAQPGVAIATATVLEVMLDPKVRLGISTPTADPSGDYAWELFDKADLLKPGAAAALKAKALKLTGGPTSAKAPQGRNTYAWVMEEKRAEVFLTYCTNALVAAKEFAALKIVPLPDALAVGADYGLIVLNDKNPRAAKLALFILSPEGQAILAGHGFAAPGLPAEK